MNFPLFSLAALGMNVLACSGGYGRGRCEAGYFEVAGECRLAVGPACQRSSDCLSSICLILEEGKGFCTISCSSHLDCPPAFRCDESLGWRCVPGQPDDQCREDSDCQPCQVCTQGVCLNDPQCVLCSADSDCGACYRCLGGECSEVAGCTRCNIDFDCPACQKCESGACQPTAGCIRCSADEQCPGCQTCRMGACQPIPGCGTDPCFNDTDCPPRTRCLQNQQLGLRTCLPVDLADGADCSAGGDPTCLGGLCLVDENGRHLCTHSCAVDADCNWPFVCGYSADCRLGCREGFVPAPGKDCRRSLDCDAGNACSLVAKPIEQRWASKCIGEENCGAADGEPCQDSRRCRSRLCGPQGYCTPVCRGALDCPQPFICRELRLPLSTGGEPKPFFGCAPEYVGGLSTGEPCREENECAGGKCVALFPEGQGRCAQVCTPQAADCPDGFLCAQDPQGSPERVCLPALAGGSCQRDADCQSGQSCALPSDASQTWSCSSREEALSAGEACTAPSDCRSGVCLAEGVCSAACGDDTDCPGGFFCDVAELHTTEGRRFFAALCLPPSDLARCWSSADCAGGSVCHVRMFQEGPGPEGRCRIALAGAALGEPCSGPFACAAGPCTEEGVCAALCQGSSDCPAGFECRRGAALVWPQAAATLNLCLDISRGLGEPCPGGEGDCAPELFCLEFELRGPVCTKACQSVFDCRPDGTGFDCVDDGSGRLVCKPR